MNENWYDLLKNEFEKDYFNKIKDFIHEDMKKHTIYPSGSDVFNAFKMTPFSNVKVVILGQDPYHGENQAHGLCFSVKEGIALPPSLENIYKEIESDLGIKMSRNGNLSKWAKEGVFLLNTVLTVRKGMANSHQGIGWEIFTNKVIEILNKSSHPICFLLWGNNAISKRDLITNPVHLVLTAPHPSPLSAYRGFFGCKHFSKANIFLEKNNEEMIDWKN